MSQPPTPRESSTSNSSDQDPKSGVPWQDDYGPWLEGDPERIRLKQARQRTANWQRWGMYLSERQWGTVREDYSASQDAWAYFPHDHARSRTYRWGEDGLLGYCDRQGRLCFAMAFWNGRDPILKERLYGVPGPEGNHGEDVKELYYYLDATPTASYAKGLYKYPQRRFPYEQLSEINRKRSRSEPEFEITDTDAFSDNAYFDCFIEYAKAAPDDILIRVTVHNRGSEGAVLHLLPQLWFRNTWLWGCEHDGCSMKPMLRLERDRILASHETLGDFEFHVSPDPLGETTWLFTENASNPNRHPGVASYSPYYKDAFHRYVVNGETTAVDPRQIGTKCAAYRMVRVEPHTPVVLCCRLRPKAEVAEESPLFGAEFDAVMAKRKEEADRFYGERLEKTLDETHRHVVRQAYAGLIWTKQFYHYVIDAWLKGDPNMATPPENRKFGRNHDWGNLFNRDVISMPDKWEYPWYAAWDLAFHMIPMAEIDPEFAKDQLVLFLREWYMHPNGQIPAYEWNLEDVNPPVHAWACWKVYKRTGPRGHRDRDFLARVFQKLLVNFTWWVNRKDAEGRNLFTGGFLGLDNIGVFDRSKPMPGGGQLDQADATSWMAFYCGCMLQMALELAEDSIAYGDMASKFFEHYIAIAEAINSLHGTGLWDENDGFYYDHLRIEQHTYPLRIRSVVGLLPMCTTVILDDRVLRRLPGFRRRMEWFLRYRPDLAKHMICLDQACEKGEGRRLMAIPSERRLRKMLSFLLNEDEFLSPFGVRSVSAVHRKQPFVFEYAGRRESVTYNPGESDSYMFGGNSNWRGPVWFPINFLLIESLRKYYKFYGDSFQVEIPTGSGRMGTLLDAADELERRLIQLFLPDSSGRRPCFGEEQCYASDPHFRDLLLFHEYFHGDNGRGLGASHQTGWTALIATMIERQDRAKKPKKRP